MTTSIGVLPYSVSVDANVELRFVTAVAESEGGIAGRRSITPLHRTYDLTIGPDTAEEVMALFVSTLGARYPICLRDYAANYQLVNEVQTPVFDSSLNATTVRLQRTFAPETGPRAYVQRILFIDVAEVPFVVSVGGSPLAPTAWYLADFGVIVFNAAPAGVVTVSGEYLIPVVFVDDAITVTTHAQGIYAITNVKFREILEQELVNLTSG